MFGEGDARLVGERWEHAGTSVGDVVLLHGGGQTRHAWRDTARILAEHGWDVVDYDARGHGESAWVEHGDYSIDLHLGDLFRAIEVCRTPPVLVGASMGGMTSIAACGEHPGRFRALAAVDIALTNKNPEVTRIRDFMTSRPDGYADLDEVAAAVAAYTPHRQRLPSHEGLLKNVMQRADGRWYWKWDPRMLNPRDFDAIRDRMRAAARRVTVPALLVRGLRSEMIDDAALADWRAHIPHSELADIAGAGHMVAGDDNNSFAQAIIAFLDRVGALPMPQGSVSGALPVAE